MNKFFEEQALPRLLKNEGFHSDHPADRGGETYCGITRVYNPEWEGWDLIDLGGATWLDLKDHVHRFYWNRYRHWRLDEIDGHVPVVASYMFDTAVLFGGRRMVEWAQDSFNEINRAYPRIRPLVVDGHIGPKTVAAVNTIRRRRNEHEAFLALLVHRRIVRHSLRVAEAPDQSVFYVGWLARAIRTNLES